MKSLQDKYKCFLKENPETFDDEFKQSYGKSARMNNCEKTLTMTAKINTLKQTH